MLGLITKLIPRMYYVDVNGKTFKCSTKGKLRNIDVRPLVGDFVEIEPDPLNEEFAIIKSVLNRKNELKRPTIANVACAVLVLAVMEPKPNFELLDRLLIQCERRNIAPLICINKIDLDAHGELKRKIEERFSYVNYDVVYVSSFDWQSIESLRNSLKNGVNVFAGPSGVGKSTLINHLNPSAQMETGNISEKLKRGKHTTRHSELLNLGKDIYLCDTPGFSGYESDYLKPQEIQEFMPDIKRNAYDCRFSDCMHIAEPDCAVRIELENARISRSRYQSYVNFVNEAKTRENNRR